VVHARIAVLAGLSPKENRSVPPLNYPRVYRLKEARPDLQIVLNGGISDSRQALAHLQHVDGVMIGRQAYHAPWFIRELDRLVHGADGNQTRQDVIMSMRPYIEKALSEGIYLKHISRHLLGLFAGEPGARAWRRHLSEHAWQSGSGFEVLEEALAKMPAALAA